MVAPLPAHVPGDALEIGQERVTDTRDPMTADRITLTLEPEHVRSAEEVVMHHGCAKSIAQRESPLVAYFREHAAPKNVLIAGCRRIRLAASQPGVEDSRHLVDRLDLDADSAGRLGDRADMSRRKERLRAEQALGFGEPEISARAADLERYKPSDYAVAGRRVVEAERTRHFAPDPHVTTERRPL
jgi:hypothetical protein